MFTHHQPSPQISDDIVNSLSKVCTSTLGHLRDYGFPRDLVPNQRPVSFVGTAVTVRIPHLDSTAVHYAADRLRPGDVLVVDMSGDYHRSCFGGMVAYTCSQRGAAGAIIDGCMNDFDEVTAYGLPVFSRGISSLTTRILGIEGEINGQVTIGGSVVNPGDVVFADSDGVVFLNPSEAAEIADLLAVKEDAEPEMRKRIAAGEQLSVLSGAASYFTKGERHD